jgi:hypothetical protein
MAKYNALKEVTDWDMDFQPNHTYFLNEAGKMVAYIKKGTSKILYNKKPMSFSKSYRKFEKVFIPEYKEQV